MGWLGDGSHRGQDRHAWTAVGLPPRYPHERAEHDSFWSEFGFAVNNINASNIFLPACFSEVSGPELLNYLAEVHSLVGDWQRPHALWLDLFSTVSKIVGNCKSNTLKHVTIDNWKCQMLHCWSCFSLQLSSLPRVTFPCAYTYDNISTSTTSGVLQGCIL